MSAARRRAESDCNVCEGAREIFSRKLGRVRCPYCTMRRLPRTDWRPMSAAEKRRRDQAELSRTIVAADFKFPGVPAHLVSTDRVLLRWGAEGSGMPSEDPDAYREALPVPLDPATFVEVNRIVRARPRDVSRFASVWYCSRNPVYVLETRMRLSRREIGRRRVDVLNDLKPEFLASRHADLVALVRFIPE